MRRRRRSEIKRLKKRGWSNNQMIDFYENQWALTNTEDLVAQLINERYVENRRTGRKTRRRAA